jgi:hypothetical protein
MDYRIHPQVVGSQTTHSCTCFEKQTSVGTKTIDTIPISFRIFCTVYLKLLFSAKNGGHEGDKEFERVTDGILNKMLYNL